MRKINICVLIVALVCLCTQDDLQADFFLDLEDATTGAMFEGDMVGDTAGPFDLNGLPMTIETTDVTGFLDGSSFGLGVNNGGADPDAESFNIGESWSFTTNLQVGIKSIELGGLSPQESFDIRSDAWINLSNVNPGAGVSYDAATGTFTLVDGPANDLFTLNELTGGRFLTFESGVDIVLGNFTSSFSPNDDLEIQNITFQVPEPASSVVLIAMMMLFRRRNNR